MERRRHAGTPVNINAMLIGEKTVPKGCRIINVSQQGMLLYCDADGRLETFNDGDTVDIHLTIQHDGEQKKLSLQAIVRHVAENSVDVEFSRPDPILMDLIESYRVSDQHSLQATLGQNHTSGITPLRISDKRQHDSNSSTPEADATGRSWPAFMPLLALILGLCIVAGGYVYTASIENRISILESRSYQQADDLSELRNRTFSFSLQEGRYNSLDSRLQALSETVTRTNSENSAQEIIRDTPTTPEIPAIPDEPANRAHAQDDGLVPDDTPEETIKLSQSPVVTGSDTTAGAITIPDSSVTSDTNIAALAVPAQDKAGPESGTDVTESAQITPSRPEAPEQPDTGSPEPGKSTGTWRINLLSSPDRGDVVHLANKATALDIPTQIVQAEVRGRTWWRLQVAGFNTRAEASTASIPIRQDLELGEVWILEQK